MNKKERLATIRTGDTTKCSHRLLVMTDDRKHRRYYECQSCGAPIKIEKGK